MRNYILSIILLVTLCITTINAEGFRMDYAAHFITGAYVDAKLKSMDVNPLLRIGLIYIASCVKESNDATGYDKNDVKWAMNGVLINEMWDGFLWLLSDKKEEEGDEDEDNDICNVTICNHDDQFNSFRSYDKNNRRFY